MVVGFLSFFSRFGLEISRFVESQFSFHSPSCPVNLAYGLLEPDVKGGSEPQVPEYQEHPTAHAWVGFARCQELVGRREESSRGCSHRISHRGQELGERVMCRAKEEQELLCIMLSSLPFLSIFSSTPPSSNVNCPFWSGEKKKNKPPPQKKSLGGCQHAALGWWLASGRDARAKRLPGRRLRRSAKSAQ